MLFLVFICLIREKSDLFSHKFLSIFQQSLYTTNFVIPKFVYTPTNLYKHQQICIHTNKSVYTPTNLCTQQQICIHTNKFLYTPTILYTQQQICKHTNKFVYTPRNLYKHQQIFESVCNVGATAWPFSLGS